MNKKIYITLLSFLLLVLILRLFYIINYVEVSTATDKDDSAIFVRNSNISAQFLVKLENDMIKEKVYSDEKKISYMDMYPDLYVDSVKPVILVEEKKTAYLTFDDGPSLTTCDILNVLDEYDVKATFFVLGCTITEEGEDCLRAMVEQGHTIGIHTYSHSYKKIYASVEAYLEDFYQDYQLIYETTGVRVNIFRFPWGSNNGYNKHIKKELVAEMERRGFTYYDWNVSAEDSVGNPTAYRIKKNIMKDLDRFDNPIILMHDASVNKLTAKTLPDVIESIIEKGYGFDTLDHRKPYQFRTK